jgi:hypothetical protein
MNPYNKLRQESRRRRQEARCVHQQRQAVRMSVDRIKEIIPLPKDFVVYDRQADTESVSAVTPAFQIVS